MLEVTRERLLALPKTDLHCHLDGSLRLDTVLELAELQGVDLGVRTREQLRQRLHVGQICASLDAYLEAFDVTLRVLQTEQALHRVAKELVEDAAKENVRYLEVRYSPILHTRGSVPLEGIVEAVLAGLAEGTQAHGVRAGLILCGIRNQSPATSYRMAELAVAYKRQGVIGFDLAGAEEDHPAKRHREAFYLILNNNINCTLHAGEAYGPESIAQAIHWCRAHRIGHGTRLREDPDLLDYVNDHRIALEVCLSSNLQTGGVPTLAQHPLRAYFDAGLRTTLNTDNRLMSDTTVTDELLLAHHHLGFTMAEIERLIIYGFKSAFLPFADKRALLEQVLAELRTLAPTEPLPEPWG